MSTDSSAFAETPLLYQALCDWFQPYAHVIVAFSAGTDSTLVLKAAVDCRGAGNVIAVTADSPSLARNELESAKALASSFGVEHKIVKTDELRHPGYLRNDELRCYHCKKSFYAAVVSTARFFIEVTAAGHSSSALSGGWVIVDGTNADDIYDIRPGLRAADEAGVKHPLIELGIGKIVVREISRNLRLATWDKPAMACLASRIAPGLPITAKKLAMIEQAESVLRDFGFAGYRVRYHELAGFGPPSPSDAALARIELRSEDYSRALESSARCELVQRIKEAGFAYVTLDLEGYKKGGRARIPGSKGRQ